MNAIIAATDLPGGTSAAPSPGALLAAPQDRRPSLVRAAFGFVASVAVTIALMIALASPEPRPQHQASMSLLRGSL